MRRLLKSMFVVVLLLPLSACITVFEQDERATARYRLTAVMEATQKNDSASPALVIARPNMGAALNSVAIAAYYGAHEWRSLAYAEWFEPLPELIQQTLLQSFEPTGGLVVSQSALLSGNHHLLKLRVNEFHVDYTNDQAQAKVTLFATLQAMPSRKVLGFSAISAVEKIDTFGEAGVIAAFNSAFLRAQKELLNKHQEWVATAK